MMVPKTILAGALLSATVTAAPAAAQATDANWFVKGGVTRLSLDDDLELNFAGSPVPGAAMDTKPHYTPTLQIGRKLTDHFAVALTVGIPPEIKVQGTGALAPFGQLASTTYGPTVLTLQYKPITTGIAQPYIGVGAAYMFVFDVDDGAFQDVEIDEDLSPALEAGIDIMFAENYGIFFDVKKAFLRTETRGTFGGAPVVGKVKLDPWAVSAGVVFRF